MWPLLRSENDVTNGKKFLDFKSLKKIISSKFSQTCVRQSCISFIFLYFWLLYLTFFYSSQHQSKFVWKAVCHSKMCKRWREKFFVRKYHFWWFAQQRYNQLNLLRWIMIHENWTIWCSERLIYSTKKKIKWLKLTLRIVLKFASKKNFSLQKYMFMFGDIF